MNSICQIVVFVEKYVTMILRLLNHMMEKHGWRNPNVGTPDRNSRGY